MLELVHGESRHSSFGIGCTMRSDEFEGPVTVAVDIQLRQALATGRTSFVASFAAVPLLQQVSWDEDLSGGPISYGDPTVLGFDGVLPRFADVERRQTTDRLRQVAAQQIDELAHLTSLRRPLRILYENRPYDDAWDPEGGDAPYLLNESDELLSAVADWYAESSIRASSWFRRRPHSA